MKIGGPHIDRLFEIAEELQDTVDGVEGERQTYVSVTLTDSTDAISIGDICVYDSEVHSELSVENCWRAYRDEVSHAALLAQPVCGVEPAI